MNHYVGIAGTNDLKSTNLKLMQYIKNHFSEKAEIELVDISDLPVFFKNKDRVIPEKAAEISMKIEAADGVIIATPEYDHSVPAVLMNALEWLSYAKHPFVGKPVMIVGASYGTLGTSRAQAHLRRILDSPELSARIMPSSEFLLGHSLQAFNEDGNLNNEEKVTLLEGLFEDFEVFSNISKHLTNANDEQRKEVENYSWKD